MLKDSCIKAEYFKLPDKIIFCHQLQTVFGALTLYIISMIALLWLRKTEPNLIRPFKVPLYPVFPIVALVIGIVSFVAMTIYNIKLVSIYILIIGISFLLFKSKKDETIKTD